MMAAMLISAMLDSDTLFSSLRFTQKHSHSTLNLTQSNSIWLKLIHSHSTWWWQPSWIWPSWIQPFCTKLCLKLIQSDSNSFILTQLDDGSHLEFCHLEFGHLGFSHLSFSSQTHSHLPGLVPTICTKKTFTHSFWLNLMMAAILNSTMLDEENFTHSFWLNLMMAAILNSTMLDSDSAILDSDTLFSSLRFTPKHSPTTLTLTQTNWICLTWWWLPSWILPSWIQPFCTKLWLKLIQSDSNSIILTQIDDGSHLEFCHLEFGHLGFSHLSFSTQTHSHLPRLVPTICTKKNLHSFILTQFDDGSHLEFYHDGFRHCHLGFRHLFSFLRFTQKHSHSTLTLDSN